MAKKTKVAIRRRRRTGNSDSTAGYGLLIMVGIATVTLFSATGAMVLGIGLIPTIILCFTVKGELKNYRLQCVAFTNLAGVLPFVKKAWNSSFNSVEQMLVDPITFVALFGSAAIGYALLYVGPLVAAYVLQGMSKDRLQQIAQQRQALIDLWSSEVLGDKNEPAPEPKGRFLPRKEEAPQ